VIAFGRHASHAAHLFKALLKQHHRPLAPLIAALLPRDGVAIDVGAHAGQFTKLFARTAPEGRVLAVEPQAYARGILTQVVRWHRLNNVTIVPDGLSDVPGVAALAVPLKHGDRRGFGLAHLGRETLRPAATEAVTLTTLDALVARERLARLDLVKADIEGWEIPLLRGGRDALARFRPALLLELVTEQAARSGTAPQEAWDLLVPLGYVACRLDGATLGAPAARFDGSGDYLFRMPR
jgi:FkbM family methyltransferase